MLIVPLHRPLTRANFPFVTALLILVNVLVFFGWQAKDDRVLEDAARYYADAGIARYEAPAYERWLAERGQALPDFLVPDVPLEFGSYTPQNADYMHSFMMVPASSLADVQAQLDAVWPSLYKLSQVENRVLAAAFASMPRTSVVAKPQLYSGQMDIYQLGMEHFGIEFLQCPLNAGPVGVPLEIPFADAIATYIVPGDTITTKMVWSFGDSMDEAMQYQNGIVLVANPAPGSSVWEAVSYITPLSDDPTKIEYTFAPGTGFLVQSVEAQEVNGKQVWVITLQVQSLP